MRPVFSKPAFHSKFAAALASIVSATANSEPQQKQQEFAAMKKVVIERKIEGVGRLHDRELSGATSTSNKALAKLAPKVQ